MPFRSLREAKVTGWCLRRATLARGCRGSELESRLQRDQVHHVSELARDPVRPGERRRRRNRAVHAGIEAGVAHEDMGDAEIDREAVAEFVAGAEGQPEAVGA